MKAIKNCNLIFKILFHVTFFIMVVLLIASPILLGNASQINSLLGIETQIGSGGAEGNMYYNTKFKTMAEVHNASLDIIEEAMKEGAVLLQNKEVTYNDGQNQVTEPALPLAAGDSVRLYGAASYYSVHMGQGSGGVESGVIPSRRVSLYDGLTGAGLSVDETMNNWYRDNGKDSVSGKSGNNNRDGESFMGASNQTSQYPVKDVAWASLPSNASQAADAAVMVIGRNSGEALDLYMDVTMKGGVEPLDAVLGRASSSNYTSDEFGDALSLAANELDVLNNLVQLKTSGTIKKVIVLMNTANPMQCQFLEDIPGIDACMWIGNIGENGATAIGKLLTGEYNPSGRTVNTFWEESAYNPVYYNFGSIQYGNAGILGDYFKTEGFMNNEYYVAYQEGIYNGYKYTETRYEDYVTQSGNAGTFDYDEVVTFPFGHGLSYTTFSYSDFSVGYDADTDVYTVNVTVTNTGDVTGKEVAEVYIQKPYTGKDIENGIEKAAAELAAFGKTDMLYPASEADADHPNSQTLTMTFKGKYLAAYDANVEKTFVIGSESADDKYLFTVAKDAHDAVNNFLAYKGYSPSSTENRMDDAGNASLVWGRHIAYDAKTYSTNAIIEEANALADSEDYEPYYEGYELNWGVDSITNRFDDVDYRKAGIFSSSETEQPYLTRGNWSGTYGIRVDLTATDALVEAQKNPAVEQDDIPYPTYGETGFYETADTFDEMKLIYLRGKSYYDPMWDTLLDQITWEDTCAVLQDALRLTHGADSIYAPSTSQQNGGVAPNHARTYGELPEQSGFDGFARMLDPDNQGQKPTVFLSNGMIAATYNTDLMMRYGEQTGEEAAWAGYNGIYGLGINIHRGAYGGRAFEYYSEDGWMTGVTAGYEAAGMHKLGVFVIAKHATLNDQETHRAGLNVWANEQSVREIYCRAVEVMVEIDREHTNEQRPNTLVGMMTGMNRIGAKWNGGHGFYNTVLKAEYGMRGYAISDYNSGRPYMSTIQGVLNGCDLPDGNPANNNSTKPNDYNGNDLRFASYSQEYGNYGKLAWAMRTSVKNIMYTVVNSNAMNGIDGDTSFVTITPAWEIAMSVLPRVAVVLFVWSAVGLLAFWAIDFVLGLRKKPEGENR